MEKIEKPPIDPVKVIHILLWVLLISLIIIVPSFTAKPSSPSCTIKNDIPNPDYDKITDWTGQINIGEKNGQMQP